MMERSVVAQAKRVGLPEAQKSQDEQVAGDSAGEYSHGTGKWKRGNPKGWQEQCWGGQMQKLSYIPYLYLEIQ
jgi:hypothetical protein